MPSYKIKRTVDAMQNINVYGSAGIAASGPLTVGGDLNVAGSLNLSSATKYKDRFISPWSFGGVASPLLSGTAASLTNYDCLGACWPCIRFGHEGSTCPVFTIIESPLDAASSGSAVIHVDWAAGSATAAGDNVAVWGACAYFLRSGSTTSEWTFAGSGVKAASIGDTSACVYGTASIAQINAPRGYPIGIKVWHNSTTGASDGAGSNAMLLGVRLRYLVDKLGS